MKVETADKLESLLDGLLDSNGDDRPGQEFIPIVQLAEGEIDPRYKRLSYSALQLFHACPRKFQLNKLRAEAKTNDVQSLTFAFGHAVGYGIAELVRRRDLKDILWEMFLAWDVDYLAENDKQKKSFPHAVQALEIFKAAMDEGYLEGYEVATYKGKPAIELSFRVDFPEGFTYRGYMDVAMRHESGEIVVLENKTSSSTWVNHYMYKNSAQAVGYSVVLDEIEPNFAAYEVLYNVYLTKLERYEKFPFPKTYTMRALWLRDILWDIYQIKELVHAEGNYGIWPMRGESCYSFGQVCEFMDVCQTATKYLMKPLREDALVEDVDYQIEVDAKDLLERNAAAEEQEKASVPDNIEILIGDNFEEFDL